jgi:anti-sigma B factor antagonist
LSREFRHPSRNEESRSRLDNSQSPEALFIPLFLPVQAAFHSRGTRGTPMAAKAEASPDGFRVWTESDHGAVVVRAAGELDIDSAGTFEDELRRTIAGERSFVTLHLGDVEFIDSTGLRALLAAVELSSMYGTRFAILRELSPPVERAFEVAGMANTLPFID